MWLRAFAFRCYERRLDQALGVGDVDGAGYEDGVVWNNECEHILKRAAAKNKTTDCPPESGECTIEKEHDLGCPKRNGAEPQTKPSTGLKETDDEKNSRSRTAECH